MLSTVVMYLHESLSYLNWSRAPRRESILRSAYSIPRRRPNNICQMMVGRRVVEVNWIRIIGGGSDEFAVDVVLDCGDGVDRAMVKPRSVGLVEERSSAQHVDGSVG
jgi:hypothetical protein